MVVLGDSSPICLGKTERGIGHQQLEWYQQEAWQALKSEEIGSESLWLSPANKHLWKAGYFKMESCMEREFRVMSGAPGTFQGVVGTIRVALFTISFWFSLWFFLSLDIHLFSHQIPGLRAFLSLQPTQTFLFSRKAFSSLSLTSVFAAETCKNSFLWQD